MRTETRRDLIIRWKLACERLTEAKRNRLSPRSDRRADYQRALVRVRDLEQAMRTASIVGVS